MYYNLNALVKPSYAVRVHCAGGVGRIIRSSYWQQLPDGIIKVVVGTTTTIHKLNANGYMMR